MVVPLSMLDRPAPEQVLLPADDILGLYPVSVRWRRSLLERLAAVAIIYRLAAAVANEAFSIRFTS